MGCGSHADLYGSSCRHMTLCLKCSKTMAENKAKCLDRGTVLTRLIREYNVRAATPTDKNYFIGKFVSGLPNFKKPLLRINSLFVKTYHKIVNSQPHKGDAEQGVCRCSRWFLRWMMKGGENDKEVGGSSGGGGRRRKKSSGIEEEEEEGNVSNRGEEDEEEEASQKSKLGLNNKSNEDDDEKGPGGGDFDMDDDDIEKGDDWEHEEIFTDDDEAVDIDPEEREDLLAPELYAPPEIKQDEENEEEEGVLSESGKELKKLPGKANGLNESDHDDTDDKDVTKEEPLESSPAKPAPSSSSRGTPSSKPSNGKRKLNDADLKKPSSSVHKKVKAENFFFYNLCKQEKSNSVSKSNAPKKAVKSETTPASVSSSSTGPVTEDKIRAVLMEKKQVTTQDLVSSFRPRLKTREDKNAFADILKKISKIQKIAGSQSFVVLRGK
ncbi:unnamed protein product [Eruca vesicaria subsp. sativa]|uniref:Transcription initiation factor IIF subunit alpha n=1 Tax=Eruca vesicaria subsp. sativa TaxID=29727 RepID=A0ABC8LX17_ERUVS|nr:unnamed protein product [Eruca vesicaria subsp. sativa]